MGVTDGTQSRRPVVVGADGGRTDGSAVRWAARHAQRTGRPLIVVHASEPEALAAQAVGAGATGITALLEAEKERTDAMAVEVEDLGRELGIVATLELHRGSPVRALLEHDDEAVLIVVGTGRKGALREWVLGTTSLGVAAHARCPVVIVNPEVEVGGLIHNRIGVAIDGSPDSRVAARLAVAYAAAVGTSVVAVNTWYLEVVDGYVVTEPESPEWKALVAEREAMLDEVMQPAREHHPEVEVTLEVRRGSTVQAVLEAAADWDMIVVGSRGLGGVQGRLLGSVSHRLMRQAPCPVIVAGGPRQ
ncbi:universal stress protein [Ornithinimicrobium tianjinense]|uniref:Universal stress protein n=1 Tax=Ornithinimicrobium tianjinense TaxID=1195761 RepID=A0A917BXL7_9MICO|nr:universal stress protein [Ornithinimicrobium tianjinense]